MSFLVLVCFGQWYKNLFVFLGLYPRPPRLVYNVCGLACIFDYLKWVFTSFILSFLGGEDRGVPAIRMCVLFCFIKQTLGNHYGTWVPRERAKGIRIHDWISPTSLLTLCPFFFSFLGGMPNLITGLKSQTLTLCVGLSQLLLVL